MKTIFVVDDDAEYLEMMRFALESYGYRMTAIQDMEQFNKEIRTFIPDIIILDLHLPGGGGPEIERMVRRKWATQDVPIIVATAMSREEALKFFSEDPSRLRIVQKPFSPLDMKECIGSMIGTGRSRMAQA